MNDTFTVAGRHTLKTLKIEKKNQHLQKSHACSIFFPQGIQKDINNYCSTLSDPP